MFPELVLLQDPLIGMRFWISSFNGLCPRISHIMLRIFLKDDCMLCEIGVSRHARLWKLSSILIPMRAGSRAETYEELTHTYE